MAEERGGARKVALVTGASGAIGSVIARHLGAAGCAVICHYNGNQERAERALAAVKEAGGDGAIAQADVTSGAAVEGLLQGVLGRWGRIDVLVNNAGITRDSLLMRLDEADWDAVLTTNLKSAYLCTRAVLRPMLRQRYGRILNVSSVVGVAGNVGQANYAAAKAGLIGLTRSTAREVATRGITVNAIAPGFIEGGMTAELPEEVRRHARSMIPMDRFGSSEEVAYAAAFLCSEGASYITGQVLQVDGGLVMG